MNDKPTGVFVRLPLSAEQEEQFDAFYEMSGGLEMAVSCLGTPVHGGGLEVLGYVPEGPLWNGAQFGMRNLYRTTADEVWPRAVTGLAEAQAQIAARDAEIARLREENEALKTVAYGGKGSVTNTIHSPARFIEGLKGGAA